MTSRDILESDKNDDEKSVGWIHAAELPTDPDAEMGYIYIYPRSTTVGSPVRLCGYIYHCCRIPCRPYRPTWSLQYIFLPNSCRWVCHASWFAAVTRQLCGYVSWCSRHLPLQFQYNWVDNNYRRCLQARNCSGIVIGWGNLNCIVSSNIYFHAPKFTDRHATILAYTIACLFAGSILMTLLLHRENTAMLAGK